MAIGDYEKLERARSAAWKLMRNRLYYGSKEEHDVAQRDYDELSTQRDRYLRDLLARLPFRWHIEHAYTPRETATYGGADHIVVDEKVGVGRIVRQPGDTLSRPRKKFWGLSSVEEGRLPSSLADIKIAERSVAAPPAKKSARRLDAEITEAIGHRSRP